MRRGHAFDPAVGDEEAETLEPLRSRRGAREDDDEVAVAGADELLAAVDEPAAVALGPPESRLCGLRSSERMRSRTAMSDWICEVPS